MKYPKMCALALAASLFPSSSFSRTAFDTALDPFLEPLPEAAVPGLPGRETGLKDWTVMVFVNGKNDLAGFAEEDLNEMESYGSTSRVNVVAELGLLRKGVRRYYVTRDEDPRAITSRVVQDLGSPDMGSWEQLADFAAWARENYPARRYMLVVWNHGSGWVTDKPAAKGISYDDETRNHISTPELRLALERSGRTDILAMDACLMQMIEVAHEVKDLADIVLASEETEPGEGYPYGEMLRAIDSLSAGHAEKIAGALVKEYGRFYSATARKATQSAVRTSALPRLSGLVDAWAGAALGFADKQKLRDASLRAASYAIDEYRDLADLLVKVSRDSGDRGLIEASDAVLRQLDRTVIANYASPAMPAGSNGLSIYVPRSPTSGRYKALRFAADTRWDEFVDSLPRYFPPPANGGYGPGAWDDPYGIGGFTNDPFMGPGREK